MIVSYTNKTFQNTKIDTDIGYHFSFSQKIFLGYQKTTSIDIQNNNTQNLKNFTNQFYTISYEYLKNNFYHYLLPEKTSLLLKLGYGSRKDNQNKNNQFFTQLEINHLFEINLKNQILIKNHSFYLSSKDYLTNELYRFGGINSIRGFRENSLQANLTTGLFTEYRYNLANNLIIHSILDYAYMEDKTISKTNKLLGIGLGFELLSENGLFHFIYSNGSANSENIKLSNSIIQIENNQNTKIKILKKKRLKVSFAESCTGGLLSSTITSINGSSKVFTLGLVVYSNKSKNSILKIPNIILKRYGAVSEQICSAMVKNLSKISKTNMSLSITGIAGPGGGTKKKPVGLVYIGIKKGNKIYVKKCFFKNKDRSYIQKATVKKSLGLILSFLK